MKVRMGEVDMTGCSSSLAVLCTVQFVERFRFVVSLRLFCGRNQPARDGLWTEI